MRISRWHRFVAPLLLVVFLTVTGCAASEPSRWDEAQQQTSGQTAVSEEAVSGSQLNQFFPEGGGDYDRVFTQEKDGFAQASLKQDGREVALLSISDTAGNPQAAQKFAQSNSTIAGYPAVQVGNSQTAVLVGDRYQVKAISKDPSFTDSDRQAWIEKFNLSGLSQL